MGIPSYFVHIVKTYPNIIKQFIPNQIEIHNLYIDSNSIIYDAIQNVDYNLYLSQHLRHELSYCSLP